jgi:competence protein ComEC
VPPAPAVPTVPPAHAPPSPSWRAPPPSPGRAAALAAGVALAWVAGCAVQLQMAELAPSHWVLALALLAALVISPGWRLRGGVPGALLLLGGVVLLAFALTHARGQARLAQALPAALEGRDLELTGTVASLPRERLEGVRFDFAVESARLDGQPVQVPPSVSLGWHRAADAGAWLGAPPLPIKAGQRWRFTARLARPHGAMNPHAFDLELWLWERGIRASGQVRARPGDPALLLDAQAAHPVERLRQSVRDALFERVADPARAGVLAALAVGDQAAIARDDWALYRDTGVAHLMSISGLHVTMFAWLATALVAALWRLHPRAPLWLPAPVAGCWAGLALATAYALVAGWGVPAQRTVAMLAVVALLRQSGWRWPVPAVWLAAGTVVVVGDPWALLQPGFWLSFVAVGLLIVSDPAGRAAAAPARGWRRAVAVLRAALSQQTVATVGLAPLTLLFFQQLSVVGFVANLVAIPLVTLLITPLALLGLVLPPLWTLAAGVLALLHTLLEALAATPLAVWHAAAAPPWAVAAGLLAAVVAVLPWPWRLRLLALPLMLPLLAPPVPRPAPGGFELIAADVGQGTAVIVRTARHVLVFDTGAAFTPEADAGERVLVPLLRVLGVRQVDQLMLSHRDSDHTGGAASLMRALPVARLVSSLEEGHPLRAMAPHTPCTAGLRWQWDGVDFQVLHPSAEELAAATPRTRANTLSCVLRVAGLAAGREGSALLTGDIESAQEQALLRDAAALLPSSVLLVPHHGSGTSSGAGFIAAVAPAVAVVQAAHRSRFGHPAPAVLARYAAAGVPVLTTAACGAWRWNGDAADPGLCVRPAQRRYWHHPVSAGPELASPRCNPGRPARSGEPAPCPSMSR